MAPAEEASHKTSCGWWVYGEQTVWESGERKVSCMAQYSENTSRRSICYRYGEIGGAYQCRASMPVSSRARNILWS